MKTLAPFRMAEHNNKISNSHTDKNKGDFAENIEIVCTIGVDFSKNEVADHSKQNKDTSISDGAKFDFTATFSGGGNDENWGS